MECDIVITSKRVSREHSRLRRDGRRVLLFRSAQRGFDLRKLLFDVGARRVFVTDQPLKFDLTVGGRVTAISTYMTAGRPLSPSVVKAANRTRSMLVVTPLAHPRWLVPTPARDAVLLSYSLSALPALVP